MSLESIDELDHVIFVYQRARPLGIGRAIARSRAARPASRCFATLRRLALSYFEPFVDRDRLPEGVRRSSICACSARYDWRLSAGNVWKVERLLFEIPHRPIAMLGRARRRRLRARYFAFRKAHPGAKADVLRPPHVDEDCRAVSTTLDGQAAES